ncbi:3-hydroxyacyl-CoA dehydrogenase family protein, partial [Pseudomonas saponiphila]
LLEGQSVEHLDKALVKFGFPVGPITLLDEVGIDVGAKISPILEKELGERFKAPAAFDKLLGDDRKGRKNGKGFYVYSVDSRGKPKKDVYPTSYGLLKAAFGELKAFEADDIIARTMIPMIIETVRCLEEGIVASPAEADMGL